MLELCSSDFVRGLTEAIEQLASLPPGYPWDILVDTPTSSSEQFVLSTPNGRLRIAAPVDFSGSTDVGFVVSAADVEIDGMNCRGAIKSSCKSGLLLDSSASGAWVHDLVVSNYNTSNSNGHAGVFVYGHPSPVSRVKVENCVTGPGNGNGIRLDAVLDCQIVGNVVSSTQGQSAEGITFGGSNIRCERNRVDRAWVSGILAWNGGAEPYRQLVISDNMISNSGQANLQIPPQANFAICLNPRSSAIHGVLLEGNVAYDDQAQNTQSCLLFLNDDGLGGVLEDGLIEGNLAYDNLSSQAVVWGSGNKITATNWVVSQPTARRTR